MLVLELIQILFYTSSFVETINDPVEKSCHIWNSWQTWLIQSTPEAYSEPCQTSQMERFAKTVNFVGTVFEKRPILDN